MNDDMLVFVPITASYTSRCGECAETIQIGERFYWRRGEAPLCVACYRAIYAEQAQPTASKLATTTPTPSVGSPSREERIMAMHTEKMQVLCDIEQAILSLMRVEKERNELLIKKGADR